MAREMHRHRTTEEARKALGNFCKAVGTAGDHSVHIFSIPVDFELDCDMILSDVITERDELLAALQDLLWAADEPEMVLPESYKLSARTAIAKAKGMATPTERPKA